MRALQRGVIDPGEHRKNTLRTDGVARAYGRWDPVYDLVFGRVFARGRNAAVEAAESVGGRVLEVSVGTGLSLPTYAGRTRLTGIDISEPMLAKAHRRVAHLRLENVPDGSFDVVVAQHVVTAVPNPEAVLNEFVRVVRRGGEIVLTSGNRRRARATRGVERVLSPLVTSSAGARIHGASIWIWSIRRGAPSKSSSGARCRPRSFSLIRMRKTERG